MYKFKKIASILASTAIMSSTMGMALAANYPAPFVENGGSNVAIIYGGSGIALTDVVAASDLKADLVDVLLSQQTGGDDSGSDTTVEGEAYELFTSSSPLLLNASLNSIRTTVTESNLPNVLADQTFTATSGSTDDSTIEATFKIDIGSNPRVIYDNEPTSSDDPTVGILIGANGANYLYNSTVTFNKGVNFTDSDSAGEDITLFGQRFTISSATDATSLVLFKSADKVFLDSTNNPLQEVVINGETYTVELVTAESTSATIKLTDSSGNSAQDEINEGASRKLLGVEVAVDTASQNNLVYSASIIVGASRIKLTDGSEIELGTEEDPIEGTQVDFTGNSATPADLTGITVQIFAEDGSNDFILPGVEFVDPVFGGFKLNFNGLESDDNRETIDVGVSGNDKMVVSLTNWQDDELSNFEWLNNESTSILADSAEWRIYTQEMATINESAYAMVGNEDDGYLVKLRTLTNSSSSTASDDRVVFENVFDTTQTWEATITAEGTGTIDIGGKQYSVTYWDDRDGDNDEYVRLNYPDSSSNDMILYPTVETNKGAKLAFYEPLTISLNNWNGASANVTGLMFPDGDGFTTITVGQPGTIGAGNWTINGNNINLTAGAQTSFLIGNLNYTVDGASANSATIYLNDMDGSTKITKPAIVLFEEQDEANAYHAVIVQTGGAGTSDNGVGVSDVDFTWNNDLGMDASSYGASGKQFESNDELYGMMDVWGTLVTTDQSTSDQYTAMISYPNDQVTAMVYVAEADATISGGSSSGGGSGTAGNILFLPQNELSSASGKNLIVIGGSCINSVAADLLGDGSALCGADFTAATDVSSGEFLVETFSRSGGTVATVVAGFDADDTVNAATWLRTADDVMIEAGKKYVGTSSSSAELVETESDSTDTE